MVEINDRTFVTSILVDKATNGQIELTLTFFLPNRLPSSQAGGITSSGNPYTALSYTGRNISEAYHNAQVDLSRKITFGHAQVLIIGEEMAKEGILNILEFIIREPSLNINQVIYVSPSKAKDIIPMVPAFENSQTKILLGYAQNKIALNTTPKDFLETDNGDMIVSRLKVGKKKMLSEKGKEAVWVGTDGVALFHQYKMVGKIASNQARGAFWLRDTVEDFLISIKSPTDQKNISIIAKQAKTKIRPSKKDPFTFDVYIKVGGNISESDSSIELQKKENIHILERIAIRNIKNRIEETFQTSKKAGADAFELGEYLSWYKPKIWKNVKEDWQTIYQDQVKLNIHVDFMLQHTGTEGNPFWKKDLSS